MKANENSISLNKYISDSGYCSRREADEIIKQRRVKINNKVAKPGNRVEVGDLVTLDGDEIFTDQKKVYIAFHKPVGVTCTTDRSVSGNIIDFIGHEQRIFPVGRLDKDSSGLILLTNDGSIVNKILRVGNAHEKEYIVTVNKPVLPAFIKKMKSGIPIKNTVTKECEIEKVNKNTFRIVLTQGLNRQIRRMCNYLDYEVRSLQRVRIMNISIGRLTLGKWRSLKHDELAFIKEATANSKDSPSRKHRKYTQFKAMSKKRNDNRSSRSKTRRKS